MKYLTAFIKQYKSVLGITILLLFLLALTLAFDIINQRRYDAFHYLAERMIQGRVDIPIVGQGAGDYVYFHGKSYWPSGPAPALLYLPFVLTFDIATNGLFIFIFTLGIGVLIYRLTRRFGFDKINSLWSVLAFIFASPLLAIVWLPREHYLAHVIIVFFLLLALYEFFTRRRFWLIGIYYAIITATRLTALPTVFFFIAESFWRQRKNWPAFLREMLALGLPILASLLVLGYYNYVRFGNWFESGYALQTIAPDLERMRQLGLFSLAHLPGNLYYFFFAAPIPIHPEKTANLLFPYITFSHWGLGLIFTAPYYISLCWLWLRDRINLLLGLATLLSAIPIFLYYGIGLTQQGYRYGTDFYPLLYVIFLRSIYHHYGNFPRRYRLLFLAIIAFNVYLFFVKLLLP